MVSQFATDLVCQHCGKKNSANQWPTHGDMVSFNYQKEPGKYQVAISCPHCCQEWYVVWDDNPGPGCENGLRPSPPAPRPQKPDAPVAPQPIRWNCIACSKGLKTTIENGGKKGKCQYCGKLQLVPIPAGVPTKKQGSSAEPVASSHQSPKTEERCHIAYSVDGETWQEREGRFRSAAGMPLPGDDEEFAQLLLRIERERIMQNSAEGVNEIRRIGQQLYDDGGHHRMVLICIRVKSILYEAGRTLEYDWHQIGEWLA